MNPWLPLPPASPRKMGIWLKLYGESWTGLVSTKQQPRKACLVYVPTSVPALGDQFTIGRLIQLTLSEHLPPVSTWSPDTPEPSIKDLFDDVYEE